MQSRTIQGVGRSAQGVSGKIKMVDRFAQHEGVRVSFTSLKDRLRGADGRMRDHRGVIIAEGSDRGVLVALNAMLDSVEEHNALMDDPDREVLTA